MNEFVFLYRGGKATDRPSAEAMEASMKRWQGWFAKLGEEGKLKDIRAILGNDIAIKTYREGKLPFPEGAIIGRIAWYHVPSQENNKVFGRDQSFVAGEAPPWYLQFMVKDSKKYAATGGWGYAQFDKDGKPGPESDLKKCFPCHQAVKDRDFIFTRYSP